MAVRNPELTGLPATFYPSAADGERPSVWIHGGSKKLMQIGKSGVRFRPMEETYLWIQENTTLIFIIVVVLLVLVIIQRVLRVLGWIGRKARRMGKPVELHPKLQAYGGHSDQELEKDKRWAAHIVATSSTGTVAGYEVVRQIEAVYVEGFRTPDDAVIALKASAARKGANAITHLVQGRNSTSKISAQGDAVVIEPTVSRSKPPNDPPPK